MEPTPSAAAITRKIPLLAESDQQLATQALNAAVYWQGQAWLTLRYTTADALLTKAQAYQTAIGTRQQAGSARPIDADELLRLDEQIDATLYRVKDRLTSKYDKKSAPAHYGVLGITKLRRAWIIDRERTKRAAALTTLVVGLQTEKIDDGEWGTRFWEPIAKRYNELVQNLTDTGGEVSKAVAAKDLLRDEIEQILYSLAKVLDANFPDTREYKAELRAAGYQRETYR